MSSLIPCANPAPGPLYWDWKCLRCDYPIWEHQRRGTDNATGIKAMLAKLQRDNR